MQIKDKFQQRNTGWSATLVIQCNNVGEHNFNIGKVTKIVRSNFYGEDGD